MSKHAIPGCCGNTQDILKQSLCLRYLESTCETNMNTSLWTQLGIQGFAWYQLQWTFSVYVSHCLPLLPCTPAQLNDSFFSDYPLLYFSHLHGFPHHFHSSRLIANTNSFIKTFLLNTYTTITYSPSNQMFLSFLLLILLSLHLNLLCVTVVSVSYFHHPLDLKFWKQKHCFALSPLVPIT